MCTKLLINIAVLALLSPCRSHIIDLESDLNYSEVFLKNGDTSRNKIDQASCTKQLVDCAEIFENGSKNSGVYEVYPKNRILPCGSLKVYCDMETDGGGWTLIQRRGDFKRPHDYFNKTWAEYKVGFGSLRKDFWLGNDNIHVLTNQKKYSIRFDLSTVQAERADATYEKFWIENEELKYRLFITDYSGTTGDAMYYHHAMYFTTKDRDNDGGKDNCSILRGGGWWYKDCSVANLNGLYFKGKNEQEMRNSTVWKTWKGYNVSLAAVEIKIRPYNFLDK